MQNLAFSVLAPTIALAALGAVYLWSKDADRRDRAWRLIRLLRGR